MDTWGYGDKEKVFFIRPLQIKNRIAVTNELYEELEEPEKVNFIRYTIADGRTIILIQNAQKEIVGELIDNSTIEKDKRCGRKRMVIPRGVVEAIEYKGNQDERVAVYKTKRNGYKTIEIINVNIDGIKG